MHEIICPHCGKAFKIDEAGYADILKQVRDHEFERQLHERLEFAEQEKRNAVQLAEAKVAAELQKTTHAKETEIEQLKARLTASETERQLAVSQALAETEKQKDALANELSKLQQERQSERQLAEARLAAELQRTASAKEAEIQALKAQLESGAISQQLAITQAVSDLEKERERLRSDLQRLELEKHLSEKSITERFQVQLRDRDEAIERLRDMKAKLSTKMLGETLEQHCETAFNMIRATAFPRAYFEKDDGDFRVTFDTNITTRREDVRLESGSYGSQLLPPDTYLMEIKISGAVPMWFLEIISGLNIYPTSFSKYGTEYKKYISEALQTKKINTRKEKELCLNQYLQLQRQIMPSA